MKKLLRITSLGSAGDTIVEVLVAMAVIGMVLGAAYAMASRSLRTGRQAQERTEALKQLESQVERIKYLADNPFAPVNVFDTTPYCLDVTLNKNPATDAACQKTGDSNLYDMSVTYTDVPADTTKNFFTIRATWERQGGGQPEEAEIKYKILQ